MPTLVQQVATFLVSGVAASGTHYAVYVALVAAGWLGPIPATVVGFCVGTVVSYVLNSRFTFRAALTRASFTRFWIVTLLGGGLNTALVATQTALGVHFGLAGLTAIAAGAAFNFAGHKLWTFREER